MPNNTTNALKRFVERVQSGWYIWLFPILAMAVCASLLFSYLRERGPSIEIRFEDAANIQVEKTKIRYRGVDIGHVNDVAISPDGHDVIVRATLRRDARHVAVEGSKFWVVSPKVGWQGVTGVEAIFMGNYIAVEPGPPDGEKQKEFKGQVGRQAANSLEGTVAYYLETRALDSVSVGDNVTFRGLAVGAVSKVYLDKTARTVMVQINIQNQYVRLIRTNTVFWRKVGVQAKLGLFNSQIKINSMESLLHGGVEFFTPTNAGKIAQALSHFPLNAEAPKGWEKWNPNLQIHSERQVGTLEESPVDHIAK